jgi:hypothetical protein
MTSFARSRQYVVIVLKLWGRAISGPVLAIASLAFLVVEQFARQAPIATEITRWGTWSTLALAVFNTMRGASSIRKNPGLRGRLRETDVLSFRAKRQIFKDGASRENHSRLTAGALGTWGSSLKFTSVIIHALPTTVKDLTIDASALRRLPIAGKAQMNAVHGAQIL